MIQLNINRHIISIVIFNMLISCAKMPQSSDQSALNKTFDLYVKKAPENVALCHGFTPVAFSKIQIISHSTHIDPYPPEARAKHITGVVIVQLCVNSLGKPESAVAISGPKKLCEYAISYTMAYKFKPYLISGKPTDVSFYMVVPFWLR